MPFLSAYTQKKYLCRLQIKDMPNNVVYLYNMYGDNTTLIDTAFANPEKKVIFHFYDTSHVGMYRCIFGDNRYLDIIFNKENIDITTSYFYPVDSLKVIASKENRLLYNYFKINRMYERKSEFLIPIIRFYPEKDKFYKIAEDEYNKLQLHRDNYINEAIRKYPDMFVSRYLKTKKAPIVDTKLPDIEKIKYIQEHFFDSFDFNDTTLMYSDAYSSKLIEFLKLFKVENATKHQEEQQYIAGIDMLMRKINRNDAAYNFFLEYMIKGFEKYKYEEVLEHIAANYRVATTCENEERKNKLQQALDFYKKTAIGATAPDIVLKDINGKTNSLYNITKDYIIVIFWQTTCPHCEEFLPEFGKYYNNDNDRNYEVYAVSIDTNTDKWKELISKSDFRWINVNENKGWDNQVMNDYNIYATPTILVLDKNKKIISKPTNLQELIQDIEKIKNK